MSYLVLLVCILSIFPSVVPYCCLPPKWEGIQMVSAGTVLNGTTTVQQAIMNVSVDTTEKKVALNMTVTTDLGTRKIRNEMSMLVDIEQKIQYIVEKGMCKKSPIINPVINLCIPSNATVVAKTSIGSEPATIYHVSLGQMGDAHLTIADNQCIPVLSQVSVTVNGAKVVESVGISGMTEGIKDMSVFTVPDVCDIPGRVIYGSAIHGSQIKIGF